MSAPRDLPDAAPSLTIGAGFRPTIDRLALRIEEVARSLGVGRRTLERLRARDGFPRPDLTIGRMPLWRPETIRAWIEGGGA
jgi:predicted DNA-binding transcriptional regulator AlpA